MHGLKKVGKIIPVIDVAGQKVVLAKGGKRSEYQPLQSIWTKSTDPIEVIGALSGAYHTTCIYVADLDAIEGQGVAWEFIERLSAMRYTILLDMGLRGPTDASKLKSLPHIIPIIATESLADLSELDAFTSILSADRVVFSLDLKQGCVVSQSNLVPKLTPQDWIAYAIKLGITKLICLDLHLVGSGMGLKGLQPALHLVKQFPEREWIVGGGINTWDEVQQLHSEGIAGVLVASALHDGRMMPLHQSPIQSSIPPLKLDCL